MLTSKVTSKGQITIPIEIRKMLGIEMGDIVSFKVSEMGIIFEKSNQPKTIQERFAAYTLNEKMQEAMKEFNTGDVVGDEEW